MYYQEYFIHTAHEEIAVYEDYETPAGESLIDRYKNAEDGDVLTFGEPATGYLYVVKRNIQYITTGEIREI